MLANMESRIKEYREYKRMIEEMQAIADDIASELKAAMSEAGQDKMIIGEYKLSFVDCVRRDLDKKRLEAEHNSLFQMYVKETSYKRFSIS